ncbi:MAG TPA: hypothetical protein VM243_17920, partial [Phycisphaerae bacterium]|nr:hypothetical protein [Phycisphaerae bacterium]
MRRYVAVLMGLCLGLSAAAWADDYTWTGLSSTDWTGTGNWDLGAVPTALDTAIFDIASTVDLFAPASVADVDVTGSLVIGGSGLTVANAFDYNGSANGVLDAVLTGDCSLNVQAGTLWVNSLSTYLGGTTVANGAALVVSSTGALGTGPIVVDTGGVMYLRGGGDPANPQNYIATLPGSPSLTVRGQFEPVGDPYGGGTGPWHSDIDVTLDGGVIGRGNLDTQVDTEYDWVFDGDITLTANGGTLGATGRVHRWATYNGDLIGAAGSKVTVDSSDGSYPCHVVANHANASFEGDWDVVDGILHVNQDGALGIGTGQTVTVNAPWRSNSWGGVEISVAQTHMPAIVVQQGYVLPQFDVASDVTLAGGMFMIDQNARIMSGNLLVTEDSSFLNRGDYAGLKLTITGSIIGDGKLSLLPGARQLRIEGDGSAHSGGWDVLGGVLQVNAAGALGTGPVNVTGGGSLTTIADSSLDGTDSVVVAMDGKLVLNSVETRQFEVQAGGALATNGLSTLDFDYENGGNVKLHKGAIISSAVTPPDPSLLADGDEEFGVWLDAGNADATVGNGTDINGDPVPYRGLAATSNLTYSSVATEATGGTLGVQFLSQAGKTLTFNGATLAPEAGNGISLEGTGRFVITGSANDFQGPIVMNGQYKLETTNTTSLLGSSVREIIINSGGMNLEDRNAGALDGVSVTVNAGGRFSTFEQNYQNVAPTAGSLTLKEGATLLVDTGSLPGLLTAGAVWDIEEGAAVQMTNGYATAGWPFTVPLRLWVNEGGNGWYTYLTGNDVLVTEDSFVSVSYFTTTNKTPTVGTDGGNRFRVPGSADGGRFSVQRGKTLQIHGDLDFTGKTLIIGNPAEVPTPDRSATSFVFYNLVHDGTISFDKYNDKLIVHGIGDIDVQAGRLILAHPDQFGGASEVHVAAGTTLQCNSPYMTREFRDSPTATMVTGKGRIRVGSNGGSGHELGLAPADTGAGVQGAGVSPGDGPGSAGVLTFQDTGLYFSEGTTGSGTVYPTLNVEILGSPTTPVAGVDHDQVVVGRPVVGLDVTDVVVTLPVPSVSCNPAKLSNVSVLTAGSGVVAPRSFAVGETIGVPGDNHWNLKAGEVGYDATSGVDLVLVGASIEWTAVPGNANLD